MPFCLSYDWSFFYLPKQILKFPWHPDYKNYWSVQELHNLYVFEQSSKNTKRRRTLIIPLIYHRTPTQTTPKYSIRKQKRTHENNNENKNAQLNTKHSKNKRLATSFTI